MFIYKGFGRKFALCAWEKGKAHFRQSFEAKIMTFQSLNAMVPRKASIAVHNEGNMLRYRPLAQRTDEKLTKLKDAPLHGRGL